MYNVKIKKYQNGETQTRLYSHVVMTGSRDDGRYHTKKLPPLSSLEEIEPFTGERVRLYPDFDNLETDIQAIEQAKRERSITVSCNRTKQKIYDLARANNWDYFVTLTFSSDKVNRYNYDECVKKLSKWLKHCREDCNSSFKYIVVPEMHEDGAYHFHGLFANCEELKMTPSGHTDFKGRTIYNIGKYRLGFTTATLVSNNSAVTKYITKYTTKQLVASTKSRKRYWNSRNCDLPDEETLLLDTYEKLSFESYLDDNAKHFKQVIYDVGFEKRAVFYFETIEDECRKGDGQVDIE